MIVIFNLIAGCSSFIFDRVGFYLSLIKNAGIILFHLKLSTNHRIEIR